MTAKHAIRLLFAALAIGFFATPIAARTIGITAQPFENRRFAQAPKLSQGWNAFQQTTQYLTDRMPLRAQAIHANTHIWTDVLGTDPRYADAPLASDEALPFAGDAEQPAGAAGKAPQPAQVKVLRGKDGWLYLEGELDRACGTSAEVVDALGRWSDLVELIRASGREVVLVVSPDKASVYPEHLPDDYPSKDCALEGKERFWKLLAGRERAGVVQLREDLVRRKARAGDDLYARKDSHWTTLGSLVLVHAVLDRIGGGVRMGPREIVDKGSAHYQGDLTVLIGAPEPDTRADREIRRVPSARRVPGRAVLVGDSFSHAPIGQLIQYFEKIEQTLWVTTPVPEIAESIAKSDRVVVQTVEREFVDRGSAAGVVAALLPVLRERLARDR
jgi:alginate O-acetyltransferase complex protein AlgJ